MSYDPETVSKLGLSKVGTSLTVFKSQDCHFVSMAVHTSDHTTYVPQETRRYLVVTSCNLLVRRQIIEVLPIELKDVQSRSCSQS